jgi:hypothetical protein
VARVRAALGPLEAGFRAATLPKTAELGDASVGALRYQQYQRDEAATKAAQVENPKAKVMMFGKLSAEDVASVGQTLDLHTEHGTGSGAADVADFLSSLRADPRLAGKMGDVEALFFESYQKTSQVSKVDIAMGARWHEAATAIRLAEFGSSDSLVTWAATLRRDQP